MIVLILVLGIAVASIAATVHAVVTDGYRRVATIRR